MPIYEFKCKSCGRRFDELCSYSEISSVRCPHCSAVEPQRLVSRVGLIGGGSGNGDGFGDFSDGGNGNGNGNGFGGSSACSSCVSRNCASCH